MLNAEESLSQKFVRKWSWIFLFTILTAPLGYIVRIVLTWDLDVSEIGILYWVIGLLLLFTVYNDFWLTESLNYFLPKYIVKKDYARCKYLLWNAFSIQIFTSIILWFLIFFGADWIADWHFQDERAKPIIQIMSLFFLGINLMQMSTIIFSVSQNTKLQKWMDFFRMFMTMIWTVWLFVLDEWTLLYYAWVWVIGLYATVVFSSILWYIYYYRPYFSWVQMHRDTILRKAFVRYSLGTFLGANIGTLLHQLDQQILQNMTSTTDVGIYAMYLSLVGIPFLIVTPIIAFLLPVISEIFSRWQYEKIRTIEGTFSNTLIIVMLWTWVLFFLVWKEVAIFFYGVNYTESGNALSIIAPFLFLNILIQIYFQILAWTGRTRERVSILLKTLILNIVLVIVSITLFKNGILPFSSAASATSLAVGLSWILMWILARRSTREYHGKTEYSWIARNTLLIALFFVLITYFSPQKIGTWLYESIRINAFIEIVLVFLIALIIFTLSNFVKIKDFIKTIQSVRNNT